MRETWFIVFTNTSTPKWWNKYLKKGFQHCWIFTEHKGVWLSIETLIWRTEIRLIEHELYTKHNVNGMLGFVLLDPDNTVVMFKKGPEFRSVPQIIPLTCVSVVESILGLRGHSITPYRLFKRLMREDMVSLFSKPKIPVQDNSAEIKAAEEREAQANLEKQNEQKKLLAERKSKRARVAGSLFSIEEDDDVSPFLGIPSKVSLG